jgi:hypothetical protein
VLFGADCNTLSLLVIVNLHHNNKGEIQMRTIYGIQNMKKWKKEQIFSSYYLLGANIGILSSSKTPKNLMLGCT